MFTVAFWFTSCSGKDEYDVRSDKGYEQTKQTLEEKEKKNPASFLTISGKNKKNLVGQTVVRGTVYNHAKIATFKDIEILLRFYSKTGALLEEDRETIFENVTPGGSKSFKSKYFTPKGTDSVSMKVLGAKF